MRKLNTKLAALAAGAGLLSIVGAAQAAAPPAQGPNPVVVAAQAKPTPKSPWGQTDLTGVWERPGDGLAAAFGPPPAAKDPSVICIIGRCDVPAEALARSMGPTSVQGIASQGPDRPKYKAQLVQKVIQLETEQIKYDPVLKCANPGLPRIGAPDKIIQSKDQVVFLYEDLSGSFWRIIPTDGRARNPSFERTPLGQGIGKWEGDTLVVTTTDMTDDTWLIDDGAFHTDNLVVTERLRRVGDTLQYEVVSDDPEVLVEPWKRSATLVRTDNEPLQPVPCQDQTVDLIVDGSHHDNAR